MASKCCHPMSMRLVTASNPLLTSTLRVIYRRERSAMAWAQSRAQVKEPSRKYYVPGRMGLLFLCLIFVVGLTVIPSIAAVLRHSFALARLTASKPIVPHYWPLLVPRSRPQSRQPAVPTKFLYLAMMAQALWKANLRSVRRGISMRDCPKKRSRLVIFSVGICLMRGAQKSDIS